MVDKEVEETMNDIKQSKQIITDEVIVNTDDKTVYIVKKINEEEYVVSGGISNLLDFQNRVTESIGHLLSGHANVFQKNLVMRLMREIDLPIKELRG